MGWEGEREISSEKAQPPSLFIRRAFSRPSSTGRVLHHVKFLSPAASEIPLPGGIFISARGLWFMRSIRHVPLPLGTYYSGSFGYNMKTQSSLPRTAIARVTASLQPLVRHPSRGSLLDTLPFYARNMCRTVSTVSRLFRFAPDSQIFIRLSLNPSVTSPGLKSFLPPIRDSVCKKTAKHFIRRLPLTDHHWKMRHEGYSSQRLREFHGAKGERGKPSGICLPQTCASSAREANFAGIKYLAPVRNTREVDFSGNKGGKIYASAVASSMNMQWYRSRLRKIVSNSSTNCGV